MNLSKTLLIGVDISENGDIPCISVGQKISDSKIEIINIFFGQDALDLYEKLTTIEKNTEVTNE